MLVGDSMNRNQFESMLCLLREGLPDKSKMFEIHGRRITKGRGYYVFKFVDFKCSVEFVRSHFLVKEGVRINAQGSSNPTLSIDVIDKTAGRWKRADILVFNTGHWWTHGKTARGKNYYKEGDYLYPKFDAVEAYRRALRTWGKWIDKNVNPKKQLVFYRGYSSAHFRGGDWDSGGTCNGETEPVLRGSILNNYPVKMKIVEEVIQEMKNPVTLLNVTSLTNFRKDGHPSIFGKNVTAGMKVSSRRQDCSHWCLPGMENSKFCTVQDLQCELWLCKSWSYLFNAGGCFWVASVGGLFPRRLHKVGLGSSNDHHQLNGKNFEKYYERPRNVDMPLLI
ncbi:hypothetical protein NC651_015461 [Populus alba x Populus x berolinensis]|nr:hypothetical protein NC651_015461 [Populus alba x Populus x berolinensis]